MAENTSVDNASHLEALSLEKAYELTASRESGLSDAEAAARKKQSTPSHHKWSSLAHFLELLKNPILLLLAFSAVLSGAFGEVTDAVIILIILLASTLLSYLQERQANSAVEQLMSLVATQYSVLRNGTRKNVGLEDVVPGDQVWLTAGSSIPGDGLLVDAEGLMVDEAALTGESVPAEKSLSNGRERVLFAGTHIQSGRGRMLVVHTGTDTLFGQVATEMRHPRPEPQFHQGIRRYGYLLMQFTLFFTFAVFVINFVLHKPVLQSFLFSLALAVGLTPQLLPAIVSVTLARGAKRMAQEKVIVKRLEAIEDLGSMDVLCSDKTGTLTQGNVKVAGAFGPDGHPDDKVLNLALLNAFGSTAFDNPIDLALRNSSKDDFRTKLDGEVPYDFTRRRQSVIAMSEGGRRLVTKGAVANVLEICSGFDPTVVDQTFRSLSDQGLRVLGVAQKVVPGDAKPDRRLEEGMQFVGFVVFEDPLRDDALATVQALRNKGVMLKLLTGDNRHVASYIADKVGLVDAKIVTGPELDNLSETALVRKVGSIDVFAEVLPIQKERLLLAVRKAGHVVGYMGDGINDGPALHAADVGISVSSAADVAREAADFVMLESGLSVISRAIDEGRSIFANTMKYVFITSSANLGNMVSMAVASSFLPFLPLLPKQILLNNFLTDIPALNIANDSVDEELIRQPRRWRVDSVQRIMTVFGLHSSAFDLMTFGVLIAVVRQGSSVFHTAWFVESAVSELLILMVIRSRKPLLKSKPGRGLLLASLACLVVVVLLPVVPFAGELGFVPLPSIASLSLIVILMLYSWTAELLKKTFMRDM